MIRRRRAIGSALLVVAALAALGAPPPAGAADGLIATAFVPPTRYLASDTQQQMARRGVLLNVKLDPDESYEFRVSGVIEEKSIVQGEEIVQRHDPVYCFVGAKGFCSTAKRSDSGAVLWASTTRNCTRPLAHFVNRTVPRYSASRHFYRFQAKPAVCSRSPVAIRLFAPVPRINAFDNPVTASGGYKVEVYGPSPKPFAVSFSVTQRGEPAPASGQNPLLVGTRTTGLGRVFFSNAPLLGRKSVGSPAGQFTHRDEFVLPGQGELFREMKVLVYRAIYTRAGPFKRVLALRGLVSEDSEPDDDAVERGDTFQINLIDDATDADDILEWICMTCEAKDSHRYVAGPKNKLDIKISAPRRVR